MKIIQQLVANQKFLNGSGFFGKSYNAMVEKLTILENLGNQCDLILDKIRNLYNSSFIYEYWTSIRTGGVHRWSM